MSNAILIGSAAFRTTENGQSTLHYLSAPLRAVATNPVQNVSAWTSADLTASRRVSIGSALHDLRATVAYDGNPQSLSALIAAGRRGAALEYFPALASPSLSFPCELVEAGDIQPDGAFWWDRRYSVEVVLRRTDGGTWQSVVEAPMLYYLAGNPLPGLTFSRSGTANEVSELGVLASAADGIFRTTWLDRDADGVHETPALLVERVGANLCLQSEDLSTTWASIGTPTLGTPHTASGVSLDLLGDDSGAAAEGKSQSITFTGDAVKAISVYWKAGTSPTPGGDELVLHDVTAATNRLFMRVSDGGGGVPSVVANTGTYLGYEYMGFGVYRLFFVTTAVTAANTNSLRCYAGRTGTVADTGNVYWGGFQVEDAEIPSSYTQTTTGTAGHAVETLYVDHTADARQAFTLYVDFDERGTALIANLGLFQIGGATASSGAHLNAYASGTSGRYLVSFNNGSASTSLTIGASGAIDWGERGELRVAVAADGTVTVGISIDGGTEVVASTSSVAGGLPFAWAAERLYLGSLGSTNQGLNPIAAVKLLPGAKTMDEMRAA